MKVLGLLMCLAAPAAAAELEPAALGELRTYRGADVVILGELHDNPAHHSHQAQAVAALQPKALVFEMLTAAQAARMPEEVPDAATLADLLQWQAGGWPDFAMYYPIFAAVPQARVYGAEVPREAARRAFDTGIAAIFGDEAKTYGLTEGLAPKDQAAREAEQAEAHCNALPVELLPDMVEVQRLRDATLARAVVQAVAETGGPVAVITGNGHARRDTGIPAVLARVAPDLAVLSLAQFEQTAPQTPPYDLLLVTPAIPREDPCKVLTGG